VFEFLGTDVLTALLQVILIDLVLAGDNAIVIGLAAAGLPEAQRGKAILIGIVAATMLRILFAGLATQILQVVGLLFAGGPNGYGPGGWYHTTIERISYPYENPLSVLRMFPDHFQHPLAVGFAGQLQIKIARPEPKQARQQFSIVNLRAMA